MAKYISPGKFRGDWYNRGRGRTVKCPRCGSAFTTFIKIRLARCPRGHIMRLLAGHGAEGIGRPKTAPRAGAVSGENRPSAARSATIAGQHVAKATPKATPRLTVREIARKGPKNDRPGEDSGAHKALPRTGPGDTV